MRVIISHDVDHLTAWEHHRDLAIPKLLLRTALGLLLGTVSPHGVARRLDELRHNRWHNLEALMTFDRRHAVPSTFFIAARSGLGLSYAPQSARFWMARILANGFGVGLHGIAYDDLEEMEEERGTFGRLAAVAPAGVRMHYLRRSRRTLPYLNRLGYRFDSTVCAVRNPWKVGDLVEFPLQIHDVEIMMRRGSRVRTVRLERAKEKTRDIIARARGLELDYLTILFHDRYFSDSFREWKAWYVWLIDYLAGREMRFVSYQQALEELGC